MSNIINGHAEASETGLVLQENLSYADWEAVLFDVAKVGKAMQWWIGDCVNYGGKRYGEMYKAAIEATGMSYGTVKQFASLCNEFELCRRRHNLSFKHHVEVWSLEPSQQDELLDRAESERLSCAKLRELVRQAKGLSVSDYTESDQETNDERPSNNGKSADYVAGPQESQVDWGDEEEQEQVASVEIADWSEQWVAVFLQAEDRLEPLRKVVSNLKPHEKVVLRDWLESEA